MMQALKEMVKEGSEKAEKGKVKDDDHNEAEHEERKQDDTAGEEGNQQHDN
jgi:hypothetical protein